jgi:enamine deaminase RidA (YjgF/YER057c/UK114 family)
MHLGSLSHESAVLCDSASPRDKTFLRSGAIMPRKLISSGSEFEKAGGYSRAVVDGDWVFVSGTTGFDYATMAIPFGLEEQVHQTFRNIAAALAQAGASLADVVRANYIVPQSADWPRITPLLGRYFGDIRPASTAIFAGLADPRMRIEIEVTARKSPTKRKRAPTGRKRPARRRRR